MELVRTKKKFAALDILKTYCGNNSYILLLKHQVTVLGENKYLTEFAADYIVRNHNIEPRQINKITEILPWYGEQLKEEYKTEFVPKKLIIVSYLGDTEYSYHCFVKYRQKMDPIKLFIPKKAVLDNFLYDDYSTVNVDFDRYDRLSTSKDPNRKIKEHQKDAVKFLLNRKRCILADDMGLGKSLELSVAAIEGNYDSVLIICPVSLKLDWKKELSWYVPEKDITIVEGILGKNKPELEEYLGYKVGKSGLKVKELQDEAKERGKWENNKFVIVNYDILGEFYKIPKSWSKANLEDSYNNSPMLQFIANKKSLVIIDEAHKLSNNDSDRYSIIKNLIKRGKPEGLFLATGTPITNNPRNFFNLLQLIGDPLADDWDYYSREFCDAMEIPAKGEKKKWTDIYLAKHKKQNWFALDELEKDELKQYIKNNARKIRLTNGASNLDELERKVRHIYLRRTKDTIGIMSNKKIHEVFYDLTLQQQFEYNKLWDEYVNEQKLLDPDKDINKELLEGAIYRKYCSNQMVPNTIRLVDFYVKKGEKVIIACCYDEELYTLRDYYGDKCVVYNGKMSSKQKEDAKNSFINNDSKKVFIGNIISAGVGLTLTVAHVLVFNNIDFVPGNDRQMEDRLYRIGQTKDVDIYYQMFRGTQYEKMWNTVMRKELVINSVIKKESEKSNV